MQSRLCIFICDGRKIKRNTEKKIYSQIIIKSQFNYKNNKKNKELKTEDINNNSNNSLKNAKQSISVN